MYSAMVQEYGKEKGKEVYYSWLNKHGYDDTKPMPEKKSITKYCPHSNIEFKTIDLGDTKEYHISGFLSVPVVDKGDKIREYADLVPEELQSKIVQRVNKGFANRASWNHDFLIEGQFLPVASGKAELKIHPQVNKKSAWVDTILDQESPKFPEILEKGLSGEIKGFSIEYALPFKHHFEEIEGKKVRIFDEATTFGFAIVGGQENPMNPMATADGGFEYKALLPEDIPEPISQSPTIVNLTVDTKSIANEIKKHISEVKMDEENFEGVSLDRQGTGVQPETKSVPEPKAVETELSVKVLEDIKAELKALKSDKQPFLNPEPKFGYGMKNVSDADADFEEYQKVVFTKNEQGKSVYSIDAQYEAAGKMVNWMYKYDPHVERRATSIGMRGQHSFEVKGSARQMFTTPKFEFKTQLTSVLNRTTSGTEYYLAAAEIADVFDPIIAAHFNDATVLWSRLKKVDASGYGDTYGFSFNYTRNTTATNYDESATDDPAGGQQLRRKAHIPFMWYRVVMQVSGPAQVSARSGIGDVWAEEVRRGTADLLKKLNQDLYDSTSPSAGMTRGGQALSLAYSTDDGGVSASLYGHTRTSGNFTTLQGNITAQTGSPRPSLENLRTMWRVSVVNGANQGDLFYVTSYTQLQWILGAMQTFQRTTPTSARLGFEGLPELDGIPILADADCDAGYIYLLDGVNTFLAIQLPPTMQEIPALGDYRKAFIKIYYNLVVKQPNHNYLMTGFATS